MVDKYAHLAPVASRSCNRRDGVRKRKLTEQEAKDAAEQVNLREGDGTVSAYPCRACPYWHVGSLPS